MKSLDLRRGEEIVLTKYNNKTYRVDEVVLTRYTNKTYRIELLPERKEKGEESRHFDGDWLWRATRAPTRIDVGRRVFYASH